MAASLPRISFSDTALTLFVGDAKESYPAEGIRAEKSSWTVLSERVHHFTSAAFARLKDFSSVNVIDKALKFTEAMFKLDLYIKGSEARSAAHNEVSNVRGYILLTKPFSKIPALYSSFKTLGSHVFSHNPVDALTFVYDYLCMVSLSLYEVANISKALGFLQKKYVDFSAKTKNFSTVFPKVFFGLHISSTLQHVVGLAKDRRDYLANSGQQLLRWRGVADDEQRLTTFDGIRKAELDYRKSVITRIVSLVKNAFEFMGDSALFVKVASSGLKTVGIVGAVSVASIELAMEILALKE